MSSLLLSALQQDSQTIHDLLLDDTLTERVRARLTAFNMLLEGKSADEIASSGTASKQTLNKWISNYIQEGIDSITTGRGGSGSNSSSKPKFYDESVMNHIKHFLNEPRTLEEIQDFMKDQLERKFKNATSLKASLNAALAEQGSKLVAVSYYILQDLDTGDVVTSDVVTDDVDTEDFDDSDGQQPQFLVA